MSAKVTERLEGVRRMSTASGPSAGGRRGYCWTHLLLTKANSRRSKEARGNAPRLFYRDLGLGLKIRATSQPKKMAAEMPPAAAVTPPVRAPSMPISSTAFAAPLASR